MYFWQYQTGTPRISYTKLCGMEEEQLRSGNRKSLMVPSTPLTPPILSGNETSPHRLDITVQEFGLQDHAPYGFGDITCQCYFSNGFCQAWGNPAGHLARHPHTAAHTIEAGEHHALSGQGCRSQRR